MVISKEIKMMADEKYKRIIVEAYYKDIKKEVFKWTPPTTIGRFFYLKRRVLLKMVKIYSQDEIIIPDILRYKMTGEYGISKEIIQNCWQRVMTQITYLDYSMILCIKACPFCVQYRTNTGCAYCEWRKKHNYCGNSKSTWNKLEHSLRFITHWELKKKYIRKYGKKEEEK